jgi:formylglycine-generating enzyme required for sulfatase activity
MGAVYKAKHNFLGELVAIKVMNADVVENADARSRFLGEMRAAGQLKHANIVRALDAEQLGELLVLVMEFVPGIALDRLVAQRGPLPVDFACRCVAQAAQGLQHAHEKGMVHRDVKPANLIVTPKDQEVKLLDFGLARGPRDQRKSNQTQMQTFMGTPDYVAPEQATDARSADIRADVYSLGCTLYFLLAGRPPFQGGSPLEIIVAQIQNEAQPITELRADVPAALWAVMARMLQKSPAARYQTPGDVARELQPFVAGPARVAPPPPPPPVASPLRGAVPVPPPPPPRGPVELPPLPTPAPARSSPPVRAPQVQPAEVLDYNQDMSPPKVRGLSPVPTREEVDEDALDRVEDLAGEPGQGKRQLLPWAIGAGVAVAGLLTAVVLGRLLLVLLEPGDNGKAPAKVVAERTSSQDPKREISSASGSSPEVEENEPTPPPPDPGPVGGIGKNAEAPPQRALPPRRRIRVRAGGTGKKAGALPKSDPGALSKEKEKPPSPPEVTPPPPPPPPAPKVVEKPARPAPPPPKPPNEVVKKQRKLDLSKQPKEIANSIGMKLVLIPRGEFTMGSPLEEMGRGGDEHPHEVEISEPFYLAVHEVTQGQYAKVMGTNPSWFTPDGGGKKNIDVKDTSNFPVEKVSWHDAVAFCRKLSALPAEKNAGRVYRLPTEAQWEYACRGDAGSSAYSAGSKLSILEANFKHEQTGFTYLKRTGEVGKANPNGWGLYDMHGNVWEWCNDWYAESYYRKSPRKDPQGPDEGDMRVVRGGGWNSFARDCRSAKRRAYRPASQQDHIGFRVAFDLYAD